MSSVWSLITQSEDKTYMWTTESYKHRHCLWCSFKTIGRKQFKNKNKRNCHQSTSIWLTCSVYKGLLCKNCIKDLHTKLIPYGRLLHADNDAFVAAINAYIGGNKQHALEDFVGHCCIISPLLYHKPTLWEEADRKAQVWTKQTACSETRLQIQHRSTAAKQSFVPDPPAK